MKYSIVKKAIELMSWLEDGTIIKDDKGLPISAVLCDLDEVKPLEFEYNIKTTISLNEYLEEFEDASNHYKSHAEYRLLEKYESSEEELSNFAIVVTIPPCKRCLEVIRSLNIKKVYYLYHNDKYHQHKFSHYKKIGLDENYIEYLNLNNYSEEKDIEKVRQNRNTATKKAANYLYFLNR